MDQDSLLVQHAKRVKLKYLLRGVVIGPLARMYEEGAPRGVASKHSRRFAWNARECAQP